MSLLTTPSHNRVLSLEGAYNVRDLGGYPIEDGGRTRWRTVLRSDSLHCLTLEAQETLIGLGLRTVIDLRYERELVECPNVFAQSGSVRYLNVPLLAGSAAEPATRAADTSPSLAGVYRRIVDERQDALRTVLAALVEPGALPALIHCTAGKDRTGVIVALLLRLAGVAPQVIAEDYAATEGLLAGAFMVDLRRRTEARGVDWETYQKLLICPPELMLGLLQHVDETYDGVEPYLRRVVGLAPKVVDTLRAALVEER